MLYPIRRRQEGSCAPVQIGECCTQFGSCAHGRKRRRHSQSCPTRGEVLPVNGRKEAENRRSDCRSGGVPVPAVRRSMLATAMPRAHTQRPRQCYGHGNATSKATPHASKVGTDRRIGPVLPTPITATEISHARARLGAYETSHRNCDRNSGACEGRRPINVDARARLCAREISRRNNGAREGRRPVNADARA